MQCIDNSYKRASAFSVELLFANSEVLIWHYDWQVGEVISMGSRAARDLSHGVKRCVRGMHTESVTSKWARRAMHRLRRGFRAARDARDAADYSWAPCVIVSMYVIGLATGVAGVILFTAALVKGLADTLPSLGASTSPISQSQRIARRIQAPKLYCFVACHIYANTY
jgi:hypothetical protein